MIKKALILILICLYAGFCFGFDLNSLSAMEKNAVKKALLKFKLQIDENPQNKTVDEIYVFTEEPFVKSEGFLQSLNKFHTLTKNQIILRKVFLKKGQIYQESLIKESQRALINPIVRSLVSIVPIKSKKNQKAVDLLVVTRDVLSLRIATDGAIVGQAVQGFVLSLGDSNIAGLNKQLAFTYALEPFIYGLTLQFYDPEVFGYLYTLLLQQGIILNNEDSSYEGASGRFAFTKPLYSQNDKWGYGFNFFYQYAPKFDLEDGKILLFEGMERKYRWFEINTSLTATRSFGNIFKNNFTFGYGVNIYRPNLYEDSTFTSQAKVRFIESVLPVKENESFAILGYSHFKNKFLTLYNYKTYEFEEIIRLGAYFSLNFNLAAQLLLSDYNFVRPNAYFGYTFKLSKESFLRLSTQGEIRYQGK
ncbi:hypothetical protein JYT19_01180, partial [Sulfobacillus acidophilus]|nr:hypothetical protein [Sulfobacillus acidophilus]